MNELVTWPCFPRISDDKAGIFYIFRGMKSGACKHAVETCRGQDVVVPAASIVLNRYLKTIGQKQICI